MATTITNKNIENVRDGFSHFYPDNKADFEEGPYSSGDFSWKSKNDFNKFVFDETKVLIRGDGDVGNIKSAQQVFEKKSTTPEKVVERTTPEDLKNLEENAARVETERKKTIADAKETVRKSIEAQQKAKDLKGKIYAKVETPPQKNTPEVDSAINELKTKDNASEHQRAMADDVAQIIEEKVYPTLKDELPKEEIHNLSRKAAVDFVEAINNPSKVAAYENFSIQDSILFATANDPKTPEHIRQAAAEIAGARRIPIEISRQFVQAGLGEDFGIFFGTVPSEIKVTIYQTPQQGTTHNLDYSKLNDGYGDFLQNQLSFVDSVGSMPIDEAKSYLFGQLTKAVDLRISALPADSLIRGLYQNTTVRNVFSLAVGQPVTISLGSESWFGGMALRVPGGLKTMNAVGGMFNVSFSTGTTAVTGGAEALAVTGAEIGGEVAAGAISTGTAEVAAGATGFTLGSLPGLAVGLVVGIVASKPIKDFVSWAQRTIGKNKEYFIGAAVALFGFRLFGLPGAVGGGLFGVLGARALLGGFKGPVRTLNYLGAGLGYIVARSLFRSIVKPLVFIVVAIPIIVAFVLFIINSGAYVVPPAPLGSAIIHIPPGGNLTKCDPDLTGPEITSQLAGSIRSGSVLFLPNSAPSRREGLCMTPTMIILHTSSGYDNDDGNIRTYETLAQRDVSCQIATDTNDTILMLSFFENQVENAWCADNLNAGGISIEMAGEPDSGFGPFSKCAPTGDQTFTPSGPHPCPDLENLSFDAICKTMQKYKIPWTQVFQHEASNGSHVDPNGDAWVDKFILRLKNNCQI